MRRPSRAKRACGRCGRVGGTLFHSFVEGGRTSQKICRRCQEAPPPSPGQEEGEDVARDASEDGCERKQLSMPPKKASSSDEEGEVQEWQGIRRAGAPTELDPSTHSPPQRRRTHYPRHAMLELPCGHQIGRDSRGGRMGTPFFVYNCGCMIQIRGGPGGVNCRGVPNTVATRSDSPAFDTPEQSESEPAADPEPP
jgi:hypothetical protein